MVTMLVCSVPTPPSPSPQPLRSSMVRQPSCLCRHVVHGSPHLHYVSHVLVSRCDGVVRWWWLLMVMVVINGDGGSGDGGDGWLTE